MHGVGGTLAFACLWLAAAPVRADDPPRVTLDYARGAGAEACPDEARLRAAVSGRLGYVPFAPPEEASVRIRATIDSTGAALRGYVATLADDGSVVADREYVSAEPDCAELASAVALAISIAIDPMVLTRPPGAPSPPSAPPSPDDPASAAAAAPDTSGRATVAGPEIALAASLFGSIGATPGSVGGGARLGASLTAGGARRWSARVEGVLDAPVSRASDDGGEIAAGRAGAEALGCVHVGWAALCAAVGVVSLFAWSREVDEPRAGGVTSISAGGRLAASLPIGSAVRLAAIADVRTALPRAELELHDASVWRSPAVGAALGAGVEVRVP